MNLKKKLNKKGFTLAELLVVVAIIAVLVAIAIPVFSAQLEKARDAVSIANLRAAYAEAAATALAADDPTDPVTIENVHFAGTQDGWSDMDDNIPFDIDSTVDGLNGTEGDYDITFTYDDTAGKFEATYDAG